MESPEAIPAEEKLDEELEKEASGSDWFVTDREPEKPKEVLASKREAIRQRIAARNGIKL